MVQLGPCSGFGFSWFKIDSVNKNQLVVWLILRFGSVSGGSGSRHVSQRKSTGRTRVNSSQHS
ncbi:hypothetical protein Hanom_Chr10g00872371 [Helianthus anomalus]